MNSLSSNNLNTNNYVTNEYMFKYVIIGDSGVGKSSVIHHFIYNKYKKESIQTVGVDFSSKEISISNTKIKLQLWDTAGQEKYRSMAKSYYRGSIGVIIIYDITIAQSFKNITEWLNDAKNLARNECSICVIGNKSDLENDRLVKFIDGAKFCQQNNLLYFECSALNGENIDEAFMSLTKNIICKIDNGVIDPSSVISYRNKKIKEEYVLYNNNCNNNKYQCSNSC